MLSEDHALVLLPCKLVTRSLPFTNLVVLSLPTYTGLSKIKRSRKYVGMVSALLNMYLVTRDVSQIFSEMYTKVVLFVGG